MWWKSLSIDKNKQKSLNSSGFCLFFKILISETQQLKGDRNSRSYIDGFALAISIDESAIKAQLIE